MSQIASTIPNSTQKFEIPGFGTPTLAIFTVVASDSSESFGFGCTNGTVHRAFATASIAQSAEALDTATRATSSACITVIDTSGSPLFEGAFLQWSSNGIEIQWGNPPPLPNTRIHVQLHKGVEATIGSTKLATSKNASTDCLGASSTPKSVILFGAGYNFDGVAKFTNSYASFGCVQENLQNRSIASALSAGTAGDTGTIGRCFASSTRSVLFFGGVTAGPTGEVTAYLPTGFTITTRDVFGTTYTGYIMLSEPLLATFMETPTAVGLVGAKIANCSPKGGMIFAAKPTADATFAAKADFSVTMFDKSSAFVAGLTQPVGVADYVPVSFASDGGPILDSVTGEIISLTNQTISVDYTIVNASSFRWLAIAFPEPSKHFRKIADVCRNAFDSLVATPQSIATAYPNTESSDAVAVLNTQFFDSQQTEIRSGVAAYIRTIGSLKISLLAGIEIGDQVLLQLADATYSAFLNLTSGIVIFRQPSIMRVGQIGDVYEVLVEIPFSAQEEILLEGSSYATALDTTYDCAGLIRSRIVDKFPAIPILLDNEPDAIPPTTGQWIHAQVLQGRTFQAELNTRRVTGRANFAIFSPINVGELDVMTLADEVADQFRLITLSGVVFRTPAIVASRRDRGYWRVDLSCPYYFEEIASV